MPGAETSTAVYVPAICLGVSFESCLMRVVPFDGELLMCFPPVSSRVCLCMHSVSLMQIIAIGFSPPTAHVCQFGWLREIQNSLHGQIFWLRRLHRNLPPRNVAFLRFSGRMITHRLLRALQILVNEGSYRQASR